MIFLFTPLAVILSVLGRFYHLCLFYLLFHRGFFQTTPIASYQYFLLFVLILFVLLPILLIYFVLLFVSSVCQKVSGFYDLLFYNILKPIRYCLVHSFDFVLFCYVNVFLNTISFLKCQTNVFSVPYYCFSEVNIIR